MIDGVGRSEPGRVSLERVSVERSAPAAKPAEVKSEKANIAPGSLSYEILAAVGPPVDVKKVAEIRAAIAEGRYAVDPQKVAQSMVDLDLPKKVDA